MWVSSHRAVSVYRPAGGTGIFAGRRLRLGDKQQREQEHPNASYARNPKLLVTPWQEF